MNTAIHELARKSGLEVLEIQDFDEYGKQVVKVAHDCCGLIKIMTTDNLKERARKKRKLCKSCSNSAAIEKRAKLTENAFDDYEKRRGKPLETYSPAILKPGEYKEAGIIVLECVTHEVYANKNAYLCKHICCGRIETIMHKQIMKRRSRKIDKCCSCARREKIAVDRAAGKIMGKPSVTRPEFILEFPAPTWAPTTAGLNPERGWLPR